MARRGTGIISVLISGDASPLRKEVDSATGFLDGFGKKIGVAMAAAGAAVGAVALKIGKDAVNAASDLAESINAVNVVFGEASKGILGLSEAAATAVGLSQREFNAFAVQFGAFTKTIAGSEGDVVAVTQELTTRIADFASVMNLDVPEAAAVFQSSLAGETEPIRRFGIDLSAAAVQLHAVEMGLVQQGQTLTEQQKVMARYSLLMQSTSLMAGDFANTSDGLANSQRILKARFDDTLAQLGQALLPAITQVAQFLLDVGIPAFQKLGEVVGMFQPQIQAVADVLTGNMQQGTDTLRRFADILRTYVLPTLQAIFLPVLAGLRTAFGFIRDAVAENAGKFSEFGQRLVPLATFIRDTLAPLVGNILRLAFEVLGKSIGVAIDFFADLLGIIGKVIDKVVELSRRIAESPLGAGIKRVVDAIVGRQMGGQVTAGTPYLVGEAGPELFIPSRSGQIVADGGMGAGTVNVYVTSADPNAVVDAIRRYTRQNGPLGQAVAV